MSRPLVLCCENRKKAVPYRQALRVCGLDEGAIRVVTPEEDGGDPTGLAAAAAGLVLGGGPDLEPSRYGEEPIAEAGLALHPQLDALEWKLLEGARAARTPVWAICRGMQTVNVFLGGTLWQDLLLQVEGVRDHNVGRPLDYLAHSLERIAADSPFGDTLARNGTRVNSRHHQAVRKLAPELEAVAYAPDGVLEVLETCSSGWWLRGVQWHPENLTALPLQRSLWRDFIAAAGAHPRGAARVEPSMR